MRSSEYVDAYLDGHECGICVKGDVITFGDDAIDKEHMQLLCMLDLPDMPLRGRH
jgi:hypothetical protein